MPFSKQKILDSYVDSIKNIYGSHVKKIILYGSYARGDFRDDSDIDIMILLDIPDEESKVFQEKLLDATFDYNFDNDIEINNNDVVIFLSYNAHINKGQIDLFM